MIYSDGGLQPLQLCAESLLPLSVGALLVSQPCSIEVTKSDISDISTRCNLAKLPLSAVQDFRNWVNFSDSLLSHLIQISELVTIIVSNQ